MSYTAGRQIQLRQQQKNEKGLTQYRFSEAPERQFSPTAEDSSDCELPSFATIFFQECCFLICNRQGLNTCIQNLSVLEPWGNFAFIFELLEASTREIVHKRKNTSACVIKVWSRL